MQKLEHIGIAVKNLSDSIPLFEALLNTGCYKEEQVDSESVRTAFFAVDDHKIELLESTDPEGIIAKFIAKKGEGIHHIAFAVNDLEAEMKRLPAPDLFFWMKNHDGVRIINWFVFYTRKTPMGY